MKNIRFIGLWMAGLIPFAVNAQGNTLTVQVKNIASSKGKILFALFNQPSGFPDAQHKALILKELPSAKGSVTINFEKLPPGTYALAVFHDANADGKLNTNALGIPKEDYGFSKNARSAFRAPTFQEASFTFNSTQTITLEVK